MIIVYTAEKNITRLNYVAQHILGNILGETFRITTLKEDFLQAGGVCINYSKESLAQGLQIIPHELLFETGVREIPDLEEYNWNGFFCFFKQEGGDIPFDLFSAAFYLLTSYEEYHSTRIDKHDRFNVNASLLYRNNALEIPLIDRWAYGLKAELEKKYLDFKCKLRKYRFISTIDIDFPFMYRHKGIFKTAALTVLDLLKANFKRAAERLGVVFRLMPDTYMHATMEIDELHKKAGREYHLFVLLGRSGQYGRNNDVSTIFYNKYLKNLKQATIGSHPSYDAFNNPQLMEKEKKELEKMLNRNVTACRRHFLRVVCPQSFREAAAAGFTDDFTLGFSKAPGFRSGTAVPYHFYDVEHDIQTDLMIHPTIMMDTTLITHLNCNPEYALFKIKQLIDECKKSGGDFLSLWHNSNLAGKEDKAWKDVFSVSFDYAASLE
ncbi:MAG: hypothetical protein LBE71_06550 [Dysgonamonadaceae bacterium]|jgi:hypothetical protein|nr:hypothetical protein [Dysgonamonadaceae bacterium]